MKNIRALEKELERDKSYRDLSNDEKDQIKFVFLLRNKFLSQNRVINENL